MKGILFKPDMIRAIVEGKKTQTRRVIKPQPTHFHYAPDGQYPCKIDGEQIYARYQVGETVYIKEAHWYPPEHNQNPNLVAYRLIVAENCGEEAAGKSIWRSPLFMPEWAARYFIKIVSVTPQRLQEVTEEDIKAEGFEQGLTKPGYYYAFGQLWNSINPKFKWNSNPWCFVYTFEFEKEGLERLK